jgi:hypothetical protein
MESNPADPMPNGWRIGSTTFDSFEDAFIQISALSHTVRGNLKTARRNTKSLKLVCRDINCPFNAYVSYNKKTASYILRQFDSNHTCIGVQQEARGSLHSAIYVEAKVSVLSACWIELSDFRSEKEWPSLDRQPLSNSWLGSETTMVLSTTTQPGGSYTQSEAMSWMSSPNNSLYSLPMPRKSSGSTPLLQQG